MMSDGNDRHKKPEGAKEHQGEAKKGLLDRRGFLRISALGGCGMLSAPAVAQAARGEFGGWPKAYGMLVDLTACSISGISASRARAMG